MANPAGSSVDERLKEWATPRQAEIIDAINQHGSQRKAAAALGVVPSLMWQALDSVKKKAAQGGYSPAHHMIHAVPDPFKVKRISTLHNAERGVTNQWVIAEPDREKLALAMEAAREAFAAELPRVLPFEKPDQTEAALCNLYTLTDCHVGMYSYHKETGADWDLEIATKTLTRCFERMVMASPSAGVGIVSQLGDFLHYDSLEPVTPLHRHLLDADGRFSKMVGVSITLLRRITEMALMRHEKVILLLAEGNHDTAASVWLRHLFAALYENEPRVLVNTSERPYYVHQHGKTMLGFHHGHLKKNDQLPLLFASLFPEIWGQTTRRFVHVGHRHHIEEREHSGMTVVQHPTLAAPDAYAARGGWISNREAKAITYHSEWGEVGRTVVTPEMVA